MTNDKDASLLDTLAAAYAETGDFEAAVKWETKAAASPGLSPQQSEMIHKHLNMYQDGKPDRED